MMNYELLNPINAVRDVITKSSDPFDNFVQMTYPHAAVHRDTISNANHYTAAGTSDVLFLFTSGSELQVHLEYMVTGGGAIQALFYESPTVTTAGTAITLSRLNRETDKTTESSVTVGGTVSNYGTLLKHQYNGGSGGGANLRGGAAVHDDAEWVLKSDTVYCLQIIRDDSAPVSVEMEWYEV